MTERYSRLSLMAAADVFQKMRMVLGVAGRRVRCYGPLTSGCMSSGFRNTTERHPMIEGLEPRQLLSGHTVAAPNAPMQPLAVADAGVATIRVYWTDNSSKETGYTVQRKKGRSGAWATVATLPANANYFRSAHLAAGSSYAYRVAAFNRGGASGWSAIVSATTVTSTSTQSTPPPVNTTPQPPALPPATAKVMPPAHKIYSLSDVPSNEPTGVGGTPASQWVDVGKDPLFAPGGPTADGIVQGATGDCYLMAALAELASDDPAVITNMVHENADQTYDVFFYQNGARTDVHVDGFMPADNPTELTYGDFGRDGSVWAAVIEKAFTYIRYSDQPASYESISGGDELGTLPFLGFDWQKGQEVEFDDIRGNAGGLFTHVHNAQELFDDIQSQLALGRPLVYSTAGANVATGSLVAAHCYGIYAATKDAAGNEYVIIRNPWGTTGPHGDGYSVETIQALYAQFFRLDAAVT